MAKMGPSLLCLDNSLSQKSFRGWILLLIFCVLYQDNFWFFWILIYVWGKNIYMTATICVQYYSHYLYCRVIIFMLSCSCVFSCPDCLYLCLFSFFVWYLRCPFLLYLTACVIFLSSRSFFAHNFHTIFTPFSDYIILAPMLSHSFILVNTASFISLHVSIFFVNIASFFDCCPPSI